MKQHDDFRQTVEVRVNPDYQSIDVDYGHKKEKFKKKNPTSFSSPRTYRFSKSFLTADKFLMQNFSPTEYMVVRMFISLSLPTFNSLKPFSDESSLREIERDLSFFFDGEMKITRNTIKGALKKMKQFGVISTPKSSGEDYSFFWVLNPLVSMKKEFLPISIRKLFDGFPITQYCIGEHNKFKRENKSKMV